MQKGGVCQNWKHTPAYVKCVKCVSSGGPLKVDNVLITKGDEMANVLKSFLWACSLKSPSHTVQEPPLDIAFTPSRVKKMLKALRPNSAQGPDKITPRFLKLNADSMSIALSLLYNMSMEEGAIRADWKLVNVTPIFKKGSKCSPSKYRPVSLTSSPWRIMESCMRDAITDHLTANAIINPSHHGFMRTKSCTTNLLHFLEKLTT